MLKDSPARVQKVEQLDRGISRCDYLTIDGFYVPDSATYEDHTDSLINCPFLFLSPKDTIIHNKDKMSQLLIGRTPDSRDGANRDPDSAARPIVLVPVSGQPTRRSSWFQRSIKKIRGVDKQRFVSSASERTKWGVGVVGTVLRTLVHELYTTECATLCKVHSSLFYVDRYIQDWKHIHGQYHMYVRIVCLLVH